MKNDNKCWEIFLEESGHRYAMSKLGSGLKTILLILINLYLIPDTDEYRGKEILYAFEEIENNNMQKKEKSSANIRFKKRGRKRKSDINNSFEDEVIHDKNYRKNIIDKVIRKYKKFLPLYLNSILKKFKVENFKFQKIETVSGQMQFDVIKKFLDSSVEETIAKGRKKYKYQINKILCKYIKKSEDKRFNEIKSILKSKNRDVYKNIFLNDHISELENDEKISYNSILTSIV